jgi:hypothetical protein
MHICCLMHLLAFGDSVSYLSLNRERTRQGHPAVWPMAAMGSVEGSCAVCGGGWIQYAVDAWMGLGIWRIRNRMHPPARIPHSPSHKSTSMEMHGMTSRFLAR